MPVQEVGCWEEIVVLIHILVIFRMQQYNRRGPSQAGLWCGVDSPLSYQCKHPRGQSGAGGGGRGDKGSTVHSVFLLE